MKHSGKCYDILSFYMPFFKYSVNIQTLCEDASGTEFVFLFFNLIHRDITHTYPSQMNKHAVLWCVTGLMTPGCCPIKSICLLERWLSVTSADPVQRRPTEWVPCSVMVTVSAAQI